MYRCAHCDDVVGPHISKAENTRVTETRSRVTYVPRRNGPPAIKRTREIAKEEAFCPPCAKTWDNDHQPPIAQKLIAPRVEVLYGRIPLRKQ